MQRSLISNQSNHAATTSPPRWLFSPVIDGLAFGGTAVVSLIAVAIAAATGWLEESPHWTWVPTVLLVDVAHVYSTAFRVYFDTREFRRHWPLYLGVPVSAGIISSALYSESPAAFWRCLAYLAVFHFVRQQYGWVALYRRVNGQTDRLGHYIDSTAVYAACIYPLLYWHCQLPRDFDWFVANDFLSLPGWINAVAWPIYLAIMAIWFTRSVHQTVTGRGWNPGKDLVVLTTAVCWYVGIVALNSDFAFTVTNVLIHGVPYMVLVYWWNVRPRIDRAASDVATGADTHASFQILPQPTDDVSPNREDSNAPLLTPPQPTAAVTTSPWFRRLFLFLATVWVLAFIEELLWHEFVLGNREWLFGTPNVLQSGRSILAGWLAVPQITHYVLDGVIWKRSQTPELTSR